MLPFAPAASLPAAWGRGHRVLHSASSVPASARAPIGSSPRGRRQNKTLLSSLRWSPAPRWSAWTVDRAWAGKNRHNVPDMPPAAGSRPVTIELNAVLVALIGEEPQVLTLQAGALLPSGPFEGDHPTLQTGLRAWVERQTHHPLRYVEQLYTFADRSRAEAATGPRIVSISYLGLTRDRAVACQREPGWQSFFLYFPWVDCSACPPTLLARAILPPLGRRITPSRTAALPPR